MSIKNESQFIGVHVVAKFFLSKAPDGTYNCISRSLGKFSVVDKAHSSVVQCQDVWVCKIVKEIRPGQNSGAFVLLPVEKIEIERVRKIIPGFYNTQNHGKAICVVPNTDPSDCWMLSKATRSIFAKKHYAVIVPIMYEHKQAESQAACG
jgi:hypothetical protein